MKIKMKIIFKIKKINNIYYASNENFSEKIIASTYDSLKEKIKNKIKELNLDAYVYLFYT